MKLREQSKKSNISTHSMAFFQEMKTLWHSPVFKNCIVLCAIMFSLCFSLYAWFVNTDIAEANQVSVKVIASSRLEISVDDGETYGQMRDLNEYGLLNSLALIDITGNGVTFLRPQLNDDGSQAVPVFGEEWGTAAEGVQYLSFNVKFRSMDRLDVYMGEGTDIFPLSQKLVLTSGEASASGDPYNASSYGLFSRDALVGAVRFSVVDTSNQLKFIWLPHPQLYLDTQSDIFELRNNVTNTGPDADLKTYIHEYYSSNTAASRASITPIYTYDFTATHTTRGSESTKIVTLSDTPDSDGYYHGEVKMNLWVEGTDAEARRALSQGRFNVSLAFYGFETDD